MPDPLLDPGFSHLRDHAFSSTPMYRLGLDNRHQPTTPGGLRYGIPPVACRITVAPYANGLDFVLGSTAG